MLCQRRSSIEDAIIPAKWVQEEKSIPFSNNDPLSPKIGCMGQIKRTNKIVGFPSTSRLNFTTSTTKNDISTNRTNSYVYSSGLNYSKLKRIFSGKNLATLTATLSSNSSTKSTTMTKANSCNIRTRRKEVAVVKNYVSIEEMDPPLPVVKKDVASGNNHRNCQADNSLWKRRSGGIPLKNLQLQEIQINKHCLAPITI